jgi:3'-phosphoadenosine 5'-phosphosulfate sulfotransferase (PAPS reductase)/FAD synthetase
MWSGGKDSTVMSHLALGVDRSLELVSEKDDLDYPGERAFVERSAENWGARLTVLEPQISPAKWMREHGALLDVGSDLHGRAAELSKRCFYEVVERHTAGRPIMLGLRSEESKGRAANRASRGIVYEAGGRLVCQPIADWTGLDVMAYALTHGVELLPLYRCVALMHARHTWRLRKSWWVPGAAGSMGGVHWLRHYYPSLYAKLVEWWPISQSLGA